MEANDGQMSQPLNNILMKVGRAKPGGGANTVCLENMIVHDHQHLPLGNGRYDKIAITDQGCGIPEKIFARCLNPLHCQINGRGLGLTTASAILGKQKGG